MTVVFQRVQRGIPGQGSQSLCWKDAEWAILGNTLGKSSAVSGGTFSSPSQRWSVISFLFDNFEKTKHTWS